MKNPVLRHKLGQVEENPAGNVLEEVAQQELSAAGSAAVTGIKSWWNGISEALGNKGRYCTLTVECMPMCN